MKKKIIIGLVFQLVALLGYTQTVIVTGTIIDANDNSQLIGTHVFLKNTNETRTAVSDYEGAFQFENVANGIYLVNVINSKGSTVKKIEVSK